MKKILTHYHKKPFANLRTGDDIAALLHVPLLELKRLAYARRGNYFLGQEPKPDGTFRTLHKPSKKLKAVQRRILLLIGKNVQVGDCVYGLNKRRGIADNAKLHRHSSHLARFDVRSYFPSIHHTTIKAIFLDLGCGDEAASLLTGLATYNNQLPQGAPTSNYLSALVLHNADYRLQSFARKQRCLYSRYFDDITISGGQDLRSAEKEVRDVLRDAGFTLNQSKTHYYGPDDEKVVTGITLRSGALFVPRQERLIDLYFQDLEAERFSPAEVAADRDRILGTIAFLNQVNRKRGALAKKRYLAATDGSRYPTH